MPFQLGQRVGDYEVVQMLGAGGMGHVYKVRNIISNRTEAMKVLLPDLTAEPDLATRFISEIRTLASFDHPNIAQLHTAFLFENQLIMMMEFVEGYTLEQMAKQRTLPVNEVAGYTSQALSALAYAHERGVVHRDIKPANLMVTTHGIVKLMDFGIAKSNAENLTHTRPGTTIGSMYYMSPEQVRGGSVDQRSDLYSMGVVLYELLAGRRPFESDSTFGILNQQVNTPPQPPIELNPSLPQRVNEVILTALAKDPAQRFQNAEDFRASLKPFISSPSGREAAVAAHAPAAVSPVPAPLPEQPLTQSVSLPPQPVAMPQQPAASGGNYPPASQWQGQAPAALPPRRSGHKALWIATGAIAAMLALVAVIFGLPMLKKGGTASATSKPPVSSSSSGQDGANGTPSPTGDGAQKDSAGLTPAPTAAIDVPSSPNSGTSQGANNGHPLPLVANSPQSASVHTSGVQTPPQDNSPNHIDTARNQGNGYVPPPPAAPVNNAELEQAEERMSQISARANTAKRAVSQIRSQQEAQGLGMRGDIETAEGQLDAYLNSANTALARGDGAAADRALDKADLQLSKLEKFLGR